LFDTGVVVVAVIVAVTVIIMASIIAEMAVIVIIVVVVIVTIVMAIMVIVVIMMKVVRLNAPVDTDDCPRSGNPVFHGRFNADIDPRYSSAVQPFQKIVAAVAVKQFQQSGHHHIPGRAHAALEVYGFRFHAARPSPDVCAKPDYSAF
jgi:hypothetical protein